MSYKYKSGLISRRGAPAMLEGVLDSIKDAVTGGAKGVVSFYGQSQKDAGAAAYALEVEKARAAAAQSSGGFKLTPTVAIIGGGALLATVLLLRRS